ncbi:hypothetical protein ACFLTM_05050 [Candidatus Bipolaricaulota bacterium]
MNATRCPLSRRSRLHWAAVVVSCALLSLQIAAHGQLAVTGELTHEYTVAPGETVEGVLVVENTSDLPVQVSVRQTDYLFFADGTNRYDDPGTVERSNALWMRLALPPRLSIPPRSSAEIHYWIDVPDDPGLTGTYWSMLLVAPVLDELPDLAATDSFGVRTVLQYGVQIVTHIGDSGEVQISLVDVQLLAEGDDVVLQVDLGNSGERWLRPEVWIELYDAEGVLVRRIESGRTRIFPGTTVRHRLALDVPPGTYSALLVLDNGDDHVWGAQYTFEL